MKAFRCRHSGLLFPEDYPKQWGRKYGIGLGPIPVSEVLDTAYHYETAAAYHKDSGVEMHPVGVCYAGLDLVDVTPEEFEAGKAICHCDDPTMARRVEILVVKQKEHKVKEAEERLRKAQA